MKKSVIGIVETQMQAEQIVTALQASGIPSSHISVLLPDKQGTKDFGIRCAEPVLPQRVIGRHLRAHEANYGSDVGGADR